MLLGTKVPTYFRNIRLYKFNFVFSGLSKQKSTVRRQAFPKAYWVIDHHMCDLSALYCRSWVAVIALSS